MFTGTGFGAALRPELAQPMRAEMLKPGRAAPLLEPIAKGFDRVRLPERCHQINQVSDLCGVDTLAQWRQNRQLVSFNNPGTTLGFAEDQLAVALHLRPEPDDVAAAHSGIEQEIECEACLGANRMSRLISGHI